MILEGVVTNVAAFGAFVDIGVHQDGLVHISALSNTFVKDPHSVVKAGQVVKVKVLEVDEKRKRIALTMCLTDEAPKVSQADKSEQRSPSRPNTPKANRTQEARKPQEDRRTAPINSAMAAAFGKLKNKD